MEILFGVFYFILGTLIGSFLNVVIFRYEEGIAITGRSICLSCGRKLAVRELIPILSFIRQRGRCSACGERISWQYPLVELGTGVLFALVFWTFYMGALNLSYVVTSTLHLVIMGLLVVIFVYDLRHTIIPNVFVYSVALLALLLLFFDTDTASFTVPTSSALLAGPLLALPLFLIWLLSRGTWMGLGDAKLTLGIGWLLGVTKGITALLLAFWTGAFVGILLLLLPSFMHEGQLSFFGKRFTMKSEIPFGPFLILGLLIAVFFDFDVVQLLFP